jgi:hypothetical protein
MDWSMKHMGGHGEGGTGQWSGSQMDVPYVPAPMVFFGMAAGFVLGMMLGTMKARKRDMMWMTGGQPWGKSHGMGMGMGMKSHHHHGDGGTMCCESHESWPSAEERQSET